MSESNKTIQPCVESDKHEKEGDSNKSIEEKELESAQKCVHESVSGIRKIVDSEEDSQNHMHPDESNHHGTSSSDEGSVESNFEDWYKRKTKCKKKHKSYSD